MKFLAAFAFVATAGIAASASAQSLPTGTYSINATVQSLSGTSCALPNKYPVTGSLVYPGAGNTNVSVAMTLQSVTPKKSVTLLNFTAFPPVPTGGLNGWSQGSPVAPNYAEIQNGQQIVGDVAADLSFNLTASGGGQLAFAQGTMTVNTGTCTETLLVTFQRASLELKS